MTSQPPPPSRSPRPSQSKGEIGLLGEAFIAEWLKTQGWTVLHQRWHCRWGEIDLVAQQPSPPISPSSGHLRSPRSAAATLVFVEVKTRSSHNWDADGLLAITAQKQAKLWQTAELFLSSHPELAELPCRFDVALVACQALSKVLSTEQAQAQMQMNTTIQNSREAIAQGQSIAIGQYKLSLKDYIQAAFT